LNDGARRSGTIVLKAKEDEEQRPKPGTPSMLNAGGGRDTGQISGNRKFSDKKIVELWKIDKPPVIRDVFSVHRRLTQ